MTEPLNVWDYLPEYREEQEDILDAVQQVFGSGRLILGVPVERFEAEFAAYCSVSHGVGVDNGTNALVLGLRALGVSAGDQVVTVANTAAPTVVAIRQVGAIPQFVDIDPRTYLMDVQQLGEAITSRTRCIIPVHLFGQCVDMEKVCRLASGRGISILEDCAQSHGARQRGRVCGGFGDASAFSFYPTKVLGAYGDGGIVLTDHLDLAQRVRRLRYYGMDPDRYFVMETPGHNARLDAVQAEILRRKLRRLDSYIAKRQRLATRYREQLADTELLLPEVAENNTHVFYVYVVRHPDRDRLMEALRAEGITVNISYPWPCHLQTGFAELGYGEGSLPHTERAAKEIFSLPMYPSLTEAQQDRVCSVLRRLLT